MNEKPQVGVGVTEIETERVEGPVVLPKPEAGAPSDVDLMERIQAEDADALSEL